MNKVITFLIVVVLIARGMMFIYDHNKSKIQNLVSPEKTPTEEVIVTPDEPDSSTVKNTDRSATVTFILTGNNEIYYYAGVFKYIVERTDADKVSKLVRKYKEITNPDELMFIIKSAEGSTYNNIINMLDAMAVNEIPASHYDEGKTTEAEMKIINIYKGK
jgi:hypothetical protein